MSRRCEEASLLSVSTYIPCGQPAVYMVKTRDVQPYAMCEMCASHNVKNRGAVILERIEDVPPL